MKTPSAGLHGSGSGGRHEPLGQKRQNPPPESGRRELSGSDGFWPTPLAPMHTYQSSGDEIGCGT